MYSKENFESELESRLNEFYHQKIVPLEKEIIKLGGNLDSEGNQNNIDLQLGRFLPKNPFIEDRENIHFWEDENSDYYKFFKSLFEECLEKEWEQNFLNFRKHGLNTDNEKWVKQQRVIFSKGKLNGENLTRLKSVNFPFYETKDEMFEMTKRTTWSLIEKLEKKQTAFKNHKMKKEIID
jgi:hypothetical protein